MPSLVDEPTCAPHESCSTRETELVAQLEQKDNEIASLRNELARSQQLLIELGMQPQDIMGSLASISSPNAHKQDGHSAQGDDESYYLQLARLRNRFTDGQETDDEASDDSGWERGDEPIEAVQPMAYVAALERWANSRAMLVDIACSQREMLLLQSVLHAWAGVLQKRRSSQPCRSGSLMILTTLEQHRKRLMESLHAAHLENRWHRQFLSGTMRVKMIMLLWSDRILKRCWLAWGAHMVRVRLEREYKDEIRQLAYALRVASLSRDGSVLNAFRRASARDIHLQHFANAENSTDGNASCESSSSNNCHQLAANKASIENPLDSYVMRKAWMGWTFIMARNKIEQEYNEASRAVVQELRKRLPRKHGITSTRTPWKDLRAKYPPIEARQFEEDGRNISDELDMPDRALRNERSVEYACDMTEHAQNRYQKGESMDSLHDDTDEKNSDGVWGPLYRWLAAPQTWFDQEVNSEEYKAREQTGKTLHTIRQTRTLALCFNMWRCELTYQIFSRQEEAEKASLLISLWRATTSGLLDTRTSAQAAGAIHAATLLNLHSSDDDEDEDEEYSK